MATELAVGYVTLVPSARGISSAISKELSGPTNAVAATAGTKAGKSFGSKFSGALKTVAKAGALGLAGALAVGIKGLSFAVDQAQESRKVAAQTAAVIKSTGGAAHVSAKQFGELATAISNKVGIDDEEIQRGENILATFTRIRNEVGKGNDIFNQATQVATDMSVALGQDMKSSAIQLGKALSDPVKGITALQRVGVTFDAGQKKQIATLVKHGKAIEAQKIILGELNKEFGGSAAAQATATDKLKVAFGNVAEQIGGVLLPYIDLLSFWIQTKGLPLIQEKLVPAIQKLATWIATKAVPAFRDKWIPVLVKIGQFITKTALPAIQKLGDGFLHLGTPAQSAIVVIGLVLKQFPSIASAAVKAVPKIAGAMFKIGKGIVKGLSGVKAAADGAKTSFAESFGSMIGSAAKAAATFAIQVAKMIAGWVLMGIQALLNAAKIALAWVISLGPIALVIAAVIAAAIIIVKNWDTIKRFVIAAAKAVVGFLQRNWPLIVAIITGPLGLVVLAVIKNWDTIKGAFSALWSFIRTIWTTVWTWVRNFVVGSLTFIVKAFIGWQKLIIGLFVGAVTWLYQAGRNILSGLWNGIRQVWASLIASLSAAKNGIKATIGGVFTKATDWLKQAGKDLITGLWNGIKEVWSDVVDWFKKLPGKVLDALGIHSPPKWAVEAGHWIMKGITKGLGLGVGSVFKFMGGIAGKVGGPLAAAWDFAFGGGGGGDIRHLGSFAQMGKNIAEAMGWVGQQWSALRTLWQNESGWNPSARNKSSGAYGIPQALPASKMGADAQASNKNLVTRAAAQIRWGLGYIRQRYGSPAAALAAWQSRTPHWYARGAWETGNEFARLHAGEMVLPARIAASVRTALTRTGAVGGATGPVAQFGDVYLSDGVDVDLLSKRLEFTLAGARM